MDRLLRLCLDPTLAVAPLRGARRMLGAPILFRVFGGLVVLWGSVSLWPNRVDAIAA